MRNSRMHGTGRVFWWLGFQMLATIVAVTAAAALAQQATSNQPRRNYAPIVEKYQTVTRMLYEVRGEKPTPPREAALLKQFEEEWGDRAAVIRATIHLRKDLCCFDVGYALSLLDGAARAGNNRAKAFLVFLKLDGVDIFRLDERARAQIDKNVSASRAKQLLMDATKASEGFALTVFFQYCARIYSSATPQCVGLDKKNLYERAARAGFAPAATGAAVIAIQSGDPDDAEYWGQEALRMGDLAGAMSIFLAGASRAAPDSRFGVATGDKYAQKYFGYLREAAYGCVVEAERLLTDFYLKAADPETLRNSREVLLWHGISATRQRAWADSLRRHFRLADLSEDVKLAVAQIAPCQKSALWLY